MDDPAGAKDVDAALHAAIHNQACGCGPFFLICIRRPYIYIDIDKYIYIFRYVNINTIYIIYCCRHFAVGVFKYTQIKSMYLCVYRCVFLILV